MNGSWSDASCAMWRMGVRGGKRLHAYNYIGKERQMLVYAVLPSPTIGRSTISRKVVSRMPCFSTASRTAGLVRIAVSSDCESHIGCSPFASIDGWK